MGSLCRKKIFFKGVKMMVKIYLNQTIITIQLQSSVIHQPERLCVELRLDLKTLRPKRVYMIIHTIFTLKK